MIGSCGDERAGTSSIVAVGDPVRLVGRDRRHPEGGARVGVHRATSSVRCGGREPGGDHVEEAADRVDRRAVGAREGVGDAEEGAEVQRRGVEQHQLAGVRAHEREREAPASGWTLCSETC